MIDNGITQFSDARYANGEVLAAEGLKRRKMKTAIAISIAATALLCATSAFAAPKLSPKDRKDTIEGLLLYEYIAWVATSNCPSAMNAFSDQKDVAHGTSLDDIVSAVLKHCRENPKEQGETAILSVLMNIQASE